MNDKSVSAMMSGPDEEKKDDRSSHKPVLGVTFVNHKGAPFGLQYAHLLTCEPAGEDLVVTFTTHKVTLSGQRLFNPPEDCLMRRIQNHKIEFVNCIPGGAARDFGQHKGFVVTGVLVEKVEEK